MNFEIDIQLLLVEQANRRSGQDQEKGRGELTGATTVAAGFADRVAVRTDELGPNLGDGATTDGASCATRARGTVGRFVSQARVVAGHGRHPFPVGVSSTATPSRHALIVKHRTEKD
ncbi:MAG: hypothetical protein KF708_10200 [Pirellulales bacterium]|nr:hypothetical protein [Pirellulales bacterium]